MYMELIIFCIYLALKFECRPEKRKHEASFYCFLMSCVRLHEAYVTFCTVEAFGWQKVLPDNKIPLVSSMKSEVFSPDTLCWRLTRCSLGARYFGDVIMVLGLFPGVILLYLVPVLYCNDSRYSQSLPLFMFPVLLLSWCFASTCFSFGYIVALNKVVLTSVVINLKAKACLIPYRSITSTRSIMLLAFHGNQESPDDRLHYPYQPYRLLTLFLYLEVQLECPFKGVSLDMRPWPLRRSPKKITRLAVRACGRVSC